MSLARVSPVRLGSLVLLLSCNMAISTKLFDRHKGWKAYGIFDASKSYDNIGVRGLLVFGPNFDSSFRKKGDTTSWSLISEIYVSMTFSVSPTEVTV